MNEDLYVTVSPVAADARHQRVDGCAGAFEDLGEPVPRGDERARNSEICIACAGDRDDGGEIVGRCQPPAHVEKRAVHQRREACSTLIRFELDQLRREVSRPVPLRSRALRRILKDLVDREVLTLWEGSAMDRAVHTLLPMCEHGFEEQNRNAAAQEQAVRLLARLRAEGLYG